MDNQGAKLLAAAILKKALDDHSDFQGCPARCRYRNTCKDASKKGTARFLAGNWVESICDIVGADVTAYREIADKSAAEKLYKATEKRLYAYTAEQARMDVLLIESRRIMERGLPSVGVVAYSEHIGKNSETLTEPERFTEQALKDQERLSQIDREIDRLDDRCRGIEYAVSALSEIERRIVEAKYFDGRSMDSISEMVRYSERQCWRLKDDAVTKIGFILFG